VIVTDSVVEALALENHLIRRGREGFNILLHEGDELSPARRVRRFRACWWRAAWSATALFAGVHAAFRAMSLTHRLFGIRSCNEVITGKRGRPCLEYDIKRCIAPCVDTICTAEEYGRAVALTELFLEARNDELLKTLKGRMIEASEGERY
jgi:excinuclease ABC subunit C